MTANHMSNPQISTESSQKTPTLRKCGVRIHIFLDKLIIIAEESSASNAYVLFLTVSKAV